MGMVRIPAPLGGKPKSFLASKKGDLRKKQPFIEVSNVHKGKFDKK